MIFLFRVHAPFDRLVTLLLLLCLLSCHTVFAKEQLDPEYAQWEASLNAKPGEVLTALDQTLSKAENDPITLAQHHFLYSETYISLTYPDKALNHANLALEVVDPKQHPWLYHKILTAKVVALDYVGQPQTALPLANQVIQWADHSEDQWLLVEAIVARGHLYNALSMSIEALNDFQRAYQMVPEQGGEINKGDIASDIALVYEYRHEDELAIPFFEESAAFHRQENDFLELSIALYGLGRANKNIGKIALGESQLEESARLARKVKDFQGEAYALKELAGIAYKQGDADRAIAMLKTTQHTFNQSNNKFMLLDTSFSLSRIYLAQGELVLAEQHLEQAKTHLDADAMPMQSISVQEQAAKLAARKGQYQQAYELLIDTVEKKQQMLTEASINKLNQFRTQYDLANKEKENALLQKENELQSHMLADHESQGRLTQLLILASVSTSLLLAFIVYRSRKNRIKFQYMAQHDGMTGMNNRSYALKKIKEALDLHHNNSLLLAMVDLDHFKTINDQYGHAVGDEVLIQFSQLCIQHFDDNVILGRFGGEEFLLAMPYGDQHQLRRSLEQLKASMSERIQQSFDFKLKVTFSAGISRCRGVDDLDKAIHRADMAMYQAKTHGRDQIILHREVNQSPQPL